MSTAASHASFSRAGESNQRGLKDSEEGALWLPALDGGTLLQTTDPAKTLAKKT
ncbi:MAG: hypothetical protein IIC59_15335 [Proteobacteria bacterium]|nr:hypothetical protein [Pseudomonadota bacterium]MCH8176546.1 hypothetical protein [Pseudomonadota bacterium]